jgi:Flp pilus assembly protein TadD
LIVRPYLTGEKYEGKLSNGLFRIFAGVPCCAYTVQLKDIGKGLAVLMAIILLISAEAVPAQENSAVSWFRKGFSAEDTGRHKEAVEAYTKAIELNPAYVEAYHNRGVANYKLGKNQEAVDDLSRAIELDPKHPRAYYNRAIVLGALRRYKEAVDDGTKAIELNPKDANAYMNRGIDCIAMHDYDRAVADFNKAIQLSPKDASVCYARGVAYHKLGRVKEAEKDFSNSAKLGYKGAQDFFKSKGYSVKQKTLPGASVPAEVGARKPGPRPKPSPSSTPSSPIEMKKPEVEIPGAGMLFGGFAAVVGFVIAVLIYALFCFPLQMIAKKTDAPNAWFAWIPILNVVLMCNIAEKPVWWLILMLVPLINIIIIVVLWMKIAEARGKPGWIGVLMLVPIVQLLVPFYLAFSE